MKKLFTKGFYIIGVFLFFFGSALPALAQSSPNVETGGLYTALAKDAQGNVYVTRVTAGTGGALGEVAKYINGKGTATVIYSGLHEGDELGPGGDSPWGLVVASNGDVYLTTDFSDGLGNIIKLKFNGGTSYTASLFQSGNFYSSLALDASDNIYTTQYDAAHGTYAIYRYPTNSTGNMAGTLIYDNLKQASGYSYPTGLAVASNNDIYVTDAFNEDGKVTDGGHVYKLTAASSYATVVTVSAGQYATSLALDASGNLYINENNGTNTAGYKLREYAGGTGSPTTIYSPLHTNGIYYPWGIAFININSIFINDGDNGTDGGALIHFIGTSPLITESGALTALNTTQGTASLSKSFTVSATNLTAGVLVTPPTGFEVSTNNTTFSGTATVGTTGTLASTSLYVRLATADAVNTYSGNIVLSSTGAANVNVAIPISTVSAPPTTTVKSISITSANPTNAPSVNYTVTFAAAITGLSTSNFSITGVAGATIGTPTTTDNKTWTVPVATGTSDGTITLNLANATGLSQGISTTLPFAGQTYTIDKTPPLATPLYMDSNNPNYSIAYIGNVVTLYFGSNETLQSYAVTIGGHSITPVTIGTNDYTASYTMTSSDVPGRIHFTLVLTDLAGNQSNYNDLAAGDDIVFLLKSAIVSVNLLSPASAQTNSTSLTYTATFSEDITGLATSSFTLTATGTATGTISSITPVSGSVYNVAITNVSGDGNLTLNLADGTGVTPAISSTLPFAGQIYTIDNTKPAISIGNPSLNTTNAGPVSYTIYYGDTNFKTATLTAADVTLNKTGTATGAVAVTGSGELYTVTISNITGSGSLGISIAAGTAIDMAGNLADPAGPSPIFTVAPPTITATGTLTALSSTYGSASASESFNVSGVNMTAGIAVTPPAGFEISADNTTFGNIVTVGVAGTIASTPVYIRLISTDAVATYSGNVVLSSTGATNVNEAIPASTVYAPVPPVLYVDAANGSDANSGTTWAKAYKTLTAALATADASVTTITMPCTIQVAAGTYSPANNASSAFAILRGGIKLSGGYPAGGGARNPTANLTTLSGTNTNYHVIVIAGLAGAADSVVVDGFTITQGNANGNGTDTYALQAVYQNSGGGVFTQGNNNGQKVAIRRCIISGNSAVNGGGGMYNINSSPAVTNCIFSTNNLPNGNGGGGMSNYDASPVITGCLFSSNNAPYGSCMTNISSSLIITNCTFSGNKVGDSNNDVIDNAYNNNNIITIANSIFWANTTTTTQIGGDGTGSLSVTYSDIQQSAGTYTGTGNINADPLFVNATGNNFQLQPSSPAINKGSNAAIPAGITTDIAGNARIIGSTVDMGAYEALQTPQILTFSPLPSKTYGNADFVPGASSDNNTNPITYTSDNTAVATIGNGNIHIVAAGTANITASQAGYAGYTAAINKVQKLTVGTVSITVTAAAQTKIYGAADPALTYTITSGALVGTDAFTGTLSRTAGTDVGAYPILQNTLALSSNYTFTYVGANLVISQASQTVTFNPLPAKTYGDSDFAPGATASTGGTITYFTDNPAVATIVNGKIHITGAGLAQITAEQYGTNDYMSATFTQLLTVNTAALTITGDSQTIIYGSSIPTLTVSYSGFVNGDTQASLTKPATATTIAISGSSSGKYSITPAGAMDNNYTISYVNGTLSIDQSALTITADNQSSTYGSSIPTLTVSYSGFVNGDTQASLTTLATAATTAASSSPSGKYLIIPSGAADNNYAITYVNGTLSIGQAPLIITANNQTINYGSAIPTLTASYSGFVNGDTKSSLSPMPTFTTTATNTSVPGTYPITAGGGIDPNYSISYVPGTLTVNAVPITFNPISAQTYGAADLSPGAVSSATISYTSSNTAVATIVSGKVHIVGKGTSTITANNGSTTQMQTLTVNPAALTITAGSNSKSYGTANPALSFAYSGFVNGDTQASLTALPAVSTTAITVSPVGKYPVTVSGGAAANYTINYVPGTLIVNPAALTITANNQTKVYGAANPALTVAYSGFVNGDSQASLTTQPTAGTTAITLSAKGTYPITASGAAGANYTISYVAGVLSVTPAPLTITADNKTGISGTPLPVFTFTYNGFVNGDSQSSLTALPTATTTATSASGTGYYPITVTGGTDPNYTITDVAGRLTMVTQTFLEAPITTTYGSTDFYTFSTATTGVTYSSSNTGVVTVSSAGLVHIVGAGIVTITFGNANGHLNKNITVNPAPLTITADNKTGISGTPLPVFTFTYSGFVNGDSQSSLTALPTATTTATSASGTGYYPITISGGTAANYTIADVAGRLTMVTQSFLKAPIATNYGDADFYTFTSATTGVTYSSSNSNVATVSQTGLIHIVSAGTITITFGNSNGSLSKSLTVNPAALTITANNQTKAAGAANPVLTVSYSGFVNGDSESSLTTQPNVATTATTASVAGTYPITATGAADANYIFTYVAGILTVTPLAGHDIATTDVAIPQENATSNSTGPSVNPAVSPNGDGVNDVLTISNIEKFPDNKLTLMNLNGAVIFEAAAYDNLSRLFDGHSSITHQMQRPGTYFYMLQYKDNGVTKSKTGYIVLKY